MRDTPYDHTTRGRELVVCYVDKVRCYNIVEGLLVQVASLMLDVLVSVWPYHRGLVLMKFAFRS